MSGKRARACCSTTGGPTKSTTTATACELCLIVDVLRPMSRLHGALNRLGVALPVQPDLHQDVSESDRHRPRRGPAEKRVTSNCSSRSGRRTPSRWLADRTDSGSLAAEKEEDNRVLPRLSFHFGIRPSPLTCSSSVRATKSCPATFQWGSSRNTSG